MPDRVIDMTSFSDTTAVSHQRHDRVESRSVPETRRRRREDAQTARCDIADVAEAAYARRHASATTDPTFHSRLALAGLRSR